jgi:hypothetical protein
MRMRRCRWRSQRWRMPHSSRSVRRASSGRDTLLAVLASKAMRPRLGVSNHGFIWVASLSITRNKRQSLISMSFSVMAGLVPAIHVIQLARSPNAWPTGRQQYRRPRCGWTTWMAGTSPAMTMARQMSRRPFHPRGPAARPVRTRNDGRNARENGVISLPTCAEGGDWDGRCELERSPRPG